MIKYKYIKTLTAGVVLALASCPQAGAYDETACDDDKGVQCWTCGSNCKATLYSDGKLSLSGRGKMKEYDTNDNGYTSTAPWIEKKNLITSVEVSGITNLGYGAFLGLKKVESINIADSVTQISQNAIRNNSLKTIYIPSSVVSIGSHNFCNNGSLELLIVPENISISVGSGGLFEGSPIATKQTYTKQGDLIYLRDSNGNITGIYDSYAGLQSSITSDKKSSYEIDDDGNVYIYNENGNLVGKYGSNNKLEAQYIHNSDGSVYTYDGNHNLIGAKKTSPFTPAEAAALVKKGNVNKVTLTFK